MSLPKLNVKKFSKTAGLRVLKPDQEILLTQHNSRGTGIVVAADGQEHAPASSSPTAGERETWSWMASSPQSGHPTHHPSVCPSPAPTSS